jgi:hypothetical protein
MWVGGQSHTPATLLHGKETWYQEAGWSPGLVWMVTENLFPTGIQSQPVVYHFTDYAILNPG